MSPNKNKKSNRSKYNPLNYWEKPLGKIIISVISGTIVILVGLLINRFFTSISKPEATKQNIASQEQINAPNSVISVGQQGGITAHTVNLAPQPRRVSPEQRDILVGRLKPLSLQSIHISYGKADPEQKKYAEDLIDALRAAGCALKISSALTMITPYEKGLTFEVNSTPPYPNGSANLQNALKEAHIDSQWIASPDMKRDVIWMVVGKQ